MIKYISIGTVYGLLPSVQQEYVMQGSCTKCPYPVTECYHKGDLECLQKKENEPDPDGEEALNYFLFPWTEEEEERNEGAR